MLTRCLGCMEQYESDFGVCPHCGYAFGSPAEEATHLTPNTILHDRYIIGKALGYGGFGVTYIAWDGRLEQKVAIKEYLPSEFSTRIPGQSKITVKSGDKSEQFHDGLDKFIDEARRLAKFHNEPGIVRIFDSFKENDTAYIVMEYLEGETLAEYLNEHGTIDEDKRLKKEVKEMPIIFKILPTVIGALMLLMGLILLAALSYRDKDYSERVTGKVIENVCKDGKLWHARYSFDHNGFTYTGIETVGHAEPVYKVGDEINIRFNRLDPQSSEADREDLLRTKFMKVLIHSGAILLLVGLALFAFVK